MNWEQRKPKKNYLPWADIKNKFKAIRGVDNLEEWLLPSSKHLNDGSLLPNFEIAVDRIFEAIKNKEYVSVSYDVDTDGITAGTIVIDYLRQYDMRLNIVYHQREDGHGISKQQIDPSTNLLIVVDSSTNEVEECKKLQEQGIDVLILDHHPQEKENPHAVVINNNGFGSKYPNKELSGVGVVYKVIEGVHKALHKESLGNEYLDLVAMGLYADVMGMDVLENRWFVYHGLKNINNVGLKALCSVLKINKYNSDTIGFNIAPVINACARMNKIEMIIELLLMQDFDEAIEKAKLCVQENQNRKKMQKKILEQNEDKIDPDNSIIMLEVSGVKKGFYGLVAMDLVDKHKKPAIVYHVENGECKGSGRAPDGVDLKMFLNLTGLAKAEGHEQAFGVTFLQQDIEEIQIVSKGRIRVKESTLIYDLELNYNEVNLDMVKKIDELNHITGKNAPKLRVLVNNVPIEARRVMGGNKDTVKLCGDNLDLIKFKVNSNYAEDCREEVNAVGQLCVNEWYDWRSRKNIVTLQLMLDDYINSL